MITGPPDLTQQPGNDAAISGCLSYRNWNILKNQTNEERFYFVCGSILTYIDVSPFQQSFAKFDAHSKIFSWYQLVDVVHNHHLETINVDFMVPKYAVKGLEAPICQ